MIMARAAWLHRPFSPGLPAITMPSHSKGIITTFAHFRRGADRGTYGPASQFLADALADSIHVFDVQLGEYDRQLIARLAQLLDPVDVAVICSWVRRAAHNCPDQSVYVAARP
jgi:hypothetical protein